ncbi:MAG TPA: hypothetical protein VGH49_19535 [Xanthobacteraceae bacterium]|jgi:hypothetical protein
MDILNDIIGFVILASLVRAIVVYAMILVPLFWGLRGLQRRRTDVGAWALVALGMAPVVFYGFQWVEGITAPARRSAEIASWPHVAAGEKLPRVLIIRDVRIPLRPFVYFLAETGLFDVYAVTGLGIAGVNDKKVWHLGVERNEHCRSARTEHTEMLDLTGWRACAVAVASDAVPADGLALYVGRTAPHAWSTSRDLSPWTLELVVRRGSVERLVAFDEFARFNQVVFHPLVGPFMSRRDQPARISPTGRSVAAERDPGEFVLASLGIEQQLIVPPFALSLEGRNQEIERLIASGTVADVQRALDIIAAAEPDEALGSAMRRLAANPATSTRMSVNSEPGWCEKIARLMRYRNDLIEGCANSPLSPDQCAQVAYSRPWRASCSDISIPIWRDRNSAAKRVFVANATGDQKVSILLGGPARLVEVRVPPDRGAIDLVVRNQGRSVLSFTGAVSCIERLTVLDMDVASTGVSGLTPDVVRFRSPTGSGSWIDPQEPFSRDFALILGRKPDAMLVDHSGPIDLGEPLPLSRSAHACGDGATIVAAPARREDGVVDIKADGVLTAPPLLPRYLK